MWKCQRFPAHFTGTGDLFSALLLAWGHEGLQVLLLLAWGHEGLQVLLLLAWGHEGLQVLLQLLDL